MTAYVKHGYSASRERLFSDVIPNIVSQCGVGQEKSKEFTTKLRLLYRKDLMKGRLEGHGNGVAFQIFMPPDDVRKYTYACVKHGRERDPAYPDAHEDQSRIYCDFQAMLRCKVDMYPWNEEFEAKLEPFLDQVEALLREHGFDEALARANVC